MIRLPLALLFVSLSSMLAGDLPLIIAHRGASDDAPENTISAIGLAVKQGADWIEFDVREIAGGHLILQHDGSVTQAEGVDVKIASLTIDQVQQIDVGAGQKMPLLREAIEACGKVTSLIEQKTGAAAAYLKVIDELGVRDQVVVQSFNWRFLRDLHELAPELQLGMLGSKPLTAARLSEIVAFKPTLVGWKHSDLTPENVRQLKAAGILVAIWTVNDPEIAKSFVSLGIDGVITDSPAAMRSALAVEH